MCARDIKAEILDEPLEVRFPTFLLFDLFVSIELALSLESTR
jgi:hypothetical protein